MSIIHSILSEIQKVMESVDEIVLKRFVSKISGGERVFVVGEGRSGFMAKSFAMRLMHLGVNSYVIGETTTPSIAPGDVLVAVSGSGKTRSVVWTSEKAKKLKCEIITITTDESSELASHASLVVHVPASTKYRIDKEAETIQPLGSLFDQSVHVLLDAVCLEYSNCKNVSNEQAFERHSNLE